MAAVSEVEEPAGPQLIYVPTKEPLSPTLRAAVVEDLKKSWYFGEAEEYRRYLKLFESTKATTKQ
jgi:hypothetical protein